METINLNGNVYVTTTLLENYGLNKNKIYSWLTKNKRKETFHFENFKDEDDYQKYWIKYQTIPLKLFKSLNLPSESELLLEIENKKDEKINALIIDKLLRAVNSDFIDFRKHYQGIFYDIDSIYKYSKLHAFFHACYQLNEVGVESKVIYNVYEEWNFGSLDLKSRPTFYRKLKKFKESGGQSLIHGALHKSRGASVLKDEVINKIEALYRDKKQFSGSKIHSKLNQWCRTKGFSEVSFSSVKSILSKPEFMNKNKVFRYGDEWAKLNFEHFRLRNDPDYNGSLWQIDGTRIQIPYSKNGKEAYLQIFVVMDVYSRSIVGYSVDESENNKMIIRAMRHAVRTTKFLPKEILRDNGKPFESQEYKYLEDYMSFMGTYSRKHLVGLPQDKGHVERFFSTFQSTVLKYYDGYIGEGIRGRRENSRPPKEVIEANRKVKNLRSKKELENLIDDAIKKYNNNRIHDDQPSPNAKFLSGNNDPNIIKISTSQFALLFWDRTSIKVKNSMVMMTEGIRSQNKHQYLIHDEDIRLRYNLATVNIRYLKNDRSVIKLFDENDKWIIDLEKSQPVDVVRDRPKVRRAKPEFQNRKLTEVIKKDIEEGKKQIYKSDGDFKEIV